MMKMASEYDFGNGVDIPQNCVNYINKIMEYPAIYDRKSIKTRFKRRMLGRKWRREQN